VSVICQPPIATAMVNYGHPSGMKKMEKSLEGLESKLASLEKAKKTKGRPTNQLSDLRKETAALRTSIYKEGLQHLKAHLVARKKGTALLTGAEIRSKLDFNHNKGYYLFQNPFGHGIQALSKEMDDAVAKTSPLLAAITASANQVVYLKLAFKNAPDSTSEEPRFFAELPPYTTENEKPFPTVGLVGQNKKFVPLPLLTSLLLSVVYTGLATRVEGKHLLFLKGAFIETITGIEERDWIDTVSHYDFDPNAQFEGEGGPITFIISLKGETPLDFGSPARHPTQVSNEKVTKEIVLKSGDGVAFSWRQAHKTGRPKKFPTEMNHRCHFMLSSHKSDVDKDDEVHIYANSINMTQYAYIESTLSPSTSK
jgi:hypothetical protein